MKIDEVSFGFYKLMKIQQFGGGLDEKGNPHGTTLWYFFCKIGEKSHIEKGGIWRTVRKMVDEVFMW